VKTLVFDIDGVLLDVRESYYRIVRELSGASLEEIRRFKDNGGFNDDWELARAATAWIKAGRPEDIFGQVKGWEDVITRCGNDPGDLSERCSALYRSGYWRHEVPLVTSALLRELATHFEIRACTGRSRWELKLAQDRLGFTFPLATTSEDVRKPDPHALLRLVPPGTVLTVMLGDSEDDRRTVERARPLTGAPIRYHHVVETPVPFLSSLLEAG
jgi:phosphoglycolate phosphatase-like HAD superfamily hydrolase